MQLCRVQLRAEALGALVANNQLAAPPLPGFAGVTIHGPNRPGPVSRLLDHSRPLVVLLPASRPPCALHRGQAALLSPPRLLCPFRTRPGPPDREVQWCPRRPVPRAAPVLSLQRDLPSAFGLHLRARFGCRGGEVSGGALVNRVRLVPPVRQFVNSAPPRAVGHSVDHLSVALPPRYSARAVHPALLSAGATPLVVRAACGATASPRLFPARCVPDARHSRP